MQHLKNKKIISVFFLVLLLIGISLFLFLNKRDREYKDLYSKEISTYDGKINLKVKQAVDHSADVSYQKAAEELKKFVPKDDTAIDVILATYYDLTLYYGSTSEYSIFDRSGKHEFTEFFAPYFVVPPPSDDWNSPHYEAFRLAFFDKNSPAWIFQFPWPTGAGIGGEALGRKLLDENTMLVYGRRGWQSYLGAAGNGCKGEGDNIDQFTFKRIEGEWKIYSIEERIDSWTTAEDSSTSDCVEINQDKIKKYR
ncbi:MAG TPA: hypothetical protein VGO63_00960 [Candidatus Paceibacterota bacterium]|jgi:hypothetical protein|nr:hypothetical protein [Candidatus Paceibacterota bacterium]